MAIGIDYNSGIPHTDGAPVHDPGTNGGKVAYDHVARVLYKHVTGTTWEVLATGGGGGGDSLGTGFTSGGGSGEIPADATAEMNGDFYFKSADDGLGFGRRSGFFSPNQYGAGDAVGAYAGGVPSGTYSHFFLDPYVIFFDAEDGANFHYMQLNAAAFSINNSGGGSFSLNADFFQAASKEVFFASVFGTTFDANDGGFLFNSTTGAIVLPRLTEDQRDALAPGAGWTIYCTDATANDSSTGVTQTYNGANWKNHW